MTSEKYKQVEHTADIAFEVYGETPEEVFIHAAEALFETLGTYQQRNYRYTRIVRLEAENMTDLFHGWLAELNYLHQVHQEVYHHFEILQLDEHILRARVDGEPIEPEVHQIELEIKAVTCHRLEFRKKRNGWQAFVIFDV